MKIKLLAFDLDGTLLHPISKSSLVNKEYVKLLQDFSDSGIKLCAITGRGKSFVDRIKKEVNRDIIAICFNGAYIPNYNHVAYIDKNIIKFLDSKIKRNLYFTIDSKIYASEENREYYILNTEKKYSDRPMLKEEFTYNDKELKNKIEENKIVKIITNDNIDFIMDDIELCHKSTSDSIEITKKGINKATGVSFVANKLSIKENEVCVVGDEENDVPMFQKFNNSFIINHLYNQHIKDAKFRIDSMLDLKKYINMI